MYDLRDYVTLAIAAQELGVDFRAVQALIFRKRLAVSEFEGINQKFIHRAELERYKSVRTGAGRPKKTLAETS